MIRLTTMLGLVLVAAAARAQVSFVDVAGECGVLHTNPYGNTFDFSAEEHPELGPIEMQLMQRNMGNGAAAGDFDDDGDLDLYLLGQRDRGNVFYRNQLDKGLRLFVDATADAGLADAGFSRMAQFADLDNDGRLDLILFNDTDLSGLYPPSRIFRNVGGRFVDVTAGSGFTPAGMLVGGACLGDYDEDGLLDIHVGFWTFHRILGPSAFPGHNRLYRNLGGFRFEDVTESSGLGIFAMDTFACAFADFDNDGDSDLYVNVDFNSDRYYRNDGGTFVDDTTAVGATHLGNDMGLTVADFDNDGDLDAYSTNITNQGGAGFGTGDFNVLVVNQLAETGTMSFVNEAADRGVKDTYWGWGTEWADVDNNGDLDLFAVNGFDEFVKGVAGSTHGLVNTPTVLFMNDGSGLFTSTVGTGAEYASDARGLIALDFDRDGDRDFLVTNVNQRAALLENRTVGQGNWLGVQLAGGCGVNADAVGARVFVTTGDTTHMQELIAGGSYLAGRPLDLHFGLGNAELIDQVRVLWPDGEQTLRFDVPVNRLVTITRTSADADANGRAELRDFAALQNCYGDLPITATGRLCGRLDANADEAIDATDLAAFVGALGTDSCN
jgi:hypothetical protein